MDLRSPGSVLFISCYELGHQPLAVASPMGFLQRAGFAPEALDIHVRASSLRADGPEYSEANQRTLAAVGGTMSAYTAGNLRYLRSATFYVTPPAEAPRTDASRPRGFFQAVANLDEHAELVEGAWPERPSSGQYGLEFVDTVVSQDVAMGLGHRLGHPRAVEPKRRLTSSLDVDVA